MKIDGGGWGGGGGCGVGVGFGGAAGTSYMRLLQGGTGGRGGCGQDDANTNSGGRRRAVKVPAASHLQAADREVRDLKLDLDRRHLPVDLLLGLDAGEVEVHAQQVLLEGGVKFTRIGVGQQGPQEIAPQAPQSGAQRSHIVRPPKLPAESFPPCRPGSF
jgi:hypothetical protein